METLQSTNTSLPGNIPHTPPYTPHHPPKRRLERADSPASSIRSIQPAETSSPAKNGAKQSIKDDVKVEELVEGDVGYITDVDVVYPEELEEAESDTGDELTSSDGNESDDGIADHFSRLGCKDGEEADFKRKRREKRRSKRMELRSFKRSHSQSVKSDTDVTDPDAMGDHDLSSSARRLRRRVRGPAGIEVAFADVPRSSRTSGGLAPAAEINEQRHDSSDSEDDRMQVVANDAMDVDESE